MVWKFYVQNLWELNRFWLVLAGTSSGPRSRDFPAITRAVHFILTRCMCARGKCSCCQHLAGFRWINKNTHCIAANVPCAGLFTHVASLHKGAGTWNPSSCLEFAVLVNLVSFVRFLVALPVTCNSSVIMKFIKLWTAFAKAGGNWDCEFLKGDISNR